MFFKRNIIRKFRQKFSKYKFKINQKIQNQKLEFSEILNHDIKNILLAQNNCLELLLKDTSKRNPLKQKEMLSQILSSNKFLTEIINNAIFLVEFENKTSNLNFENINIVNQTQFCLNCIKNLVKDKSQKVIFDIKNDKIKLSADKNLIQKIILNLLISSISYGYEKSDIVISIEENDNQISYLAKNKSIYMTKEKLNSLFEDTKNGKDFNQLGMKLNLNIAKKLITAHNWDFIATSNKNDNSSVFGFVVKKR